MSANASGATVANLYYNQPLLAVMAQSLHASAHAAGFTPMLTQIGYAVGVGLGIAITTLSFLVFWGLGHQLWGLVVAAILLDLGVQTTQISNQARIYSLPAEIHSRLNALYIMFYFVGGAIGSFLGAYGWSRWQWNGVCALSLLMLTAAFATFFRKRQNRHFLALLTK